MVSDDTEHTVLLCRALMRHPDNVDAFLRELAWGLKWWLLGAPAGIGWATLRAIIRLWLGFSPRKSGVMSAGNGPAMRIAAAGILFADDLEKLRLYVQAATRLTHRDPKALTGAMAVALTAAHRTRHALGREADPNPRIQDLAQIDRNDEEWQGLMKDVQSGLDRQLSLQEFAQTLGLSRGVSGYMFYTVPVCLYALYRHAGDFKTGMESLLNLGGDTDTVGAVYGAIAGMDGTIPEEWVRNLRDFPLSMKFLERQARALSSVAASRTPVHPGHFPWYAVPFRNAFFFFVVIGHCLRRIIPC